MMIQQTMPNTSRAGKPNKIKITFGLPQFYEEYIKDIPEDSKFYISKALYRYIVEKYWAAVRDYVIYEHGVFKFNRYLGSIRVKRMVTRTKSLKYNYSHYLKTGEKIYHLNEHTNGFYFKFYWAGGLYKNKKIYKFTANRAHMSRKLSAYLYTTPPHKVHYY